MKSGTRARRAFNLRWKNKDVDCVIEWLNNRDENDVAINLKLYQIEIKTKADRRLLTETKLRIIRSDISKKKARDKIEQMIRHFEIIKQITETTKWKINVIKHDVVFSNSQDMLIKDVLVKKCFYYYEFEKLLKDSFITNVSFSMKSTRSNLQKHIIITEMKKDTEIDNQKFTLLETQIKQDVFENVYSDWINDNEKNDNDKDDNEKDDHEKDD
jgi:hypothetical protein